GLVHRDIKPANLLLDRSGQIKILDLGIARFTLDPDPRGSEPDVILGTPDYLAPEQAVDSRAVDHRADQYALGATLYFLLAGHPPFPETDVSRKLHHKQNTDPIPLHQLRPDVPPGLSAAIGRLLARSPAARFPTPAEVAAALEPWADPGPHFPARLFQPSQPTGADPIGRPTDPGRDRDPTPLPVTRRLTRPGLIVDPTPPSSEPHRPGVSEIGEPSPEPTATETGPLTIPLTHPPTPPVAERGTRRWSWLWWAAVAITGLVSILVWGLKRER
ncbi:MAG TPA: protein kinase, partial [Gemmataceae bacterium]|nr:protein kinase [Gemmataceae bacterium]